jgi:outer membrane PBP1 activator LpoA protein
MKKLWSKFLAPLVVVICLLSGCSAGMRSSVMHGLPLPSMGAQPQKIALLLPLQGQYAASAQAIRNGFLAAYYYDKQNNSSVPDVVVLDTSMQNVRSVYDQAVAQGANFVVGPLTKDQVSELASSSNLPVPTLALNSLDTNQAVPNNMYFFGLSPRDEAIQAAEKASQDGHHNAIVIAPATPWGQGVASAFTQRWQSLGGTVVGNLAFTHEQNLSTDIGNLLQVDKSVRSSQGFKKAIKDKVPLNQLHRQDFDMVFIVASPSQARLIRPLLKFYFAGNIAEYATSSVYSGRPSPMHDRDLDGIMFCDMPWTLDDNGQLSPNLAAIKSRIIALWPSSYQSYPKLYAMGIDAYNLVQNFNRLGSSSQSALPGATGNLYISGSHEISRQLPWARMQNGVPVLY